MARVDSRWNVTFQRLDSLPPTPEPTLLLESILMEEDGTHRIEVVSNTWVDRDLVLADHGTAEEKEQRCYKGAFQRYRQRLLWQMIKRRWFATLTDYNTNRLFIQQSPSAFTTFVHEVVERVANALRRAAAADDQVAEVVRSDAARLVLKGGNMVNLLTFSSLRTLPQGLQAWRKEWQ